MSDPSTKYQHIQIGLVIAFAAVLWTIAYQTPRSAFELFIGQYFLAFGMFYILWLNKAAFTFKHFAWISFGLRIVILFAIPQLSNDFYRFIWDGELMTMGINPYAHTPEFLMSHGTFMADPYLSELFLGMGELSQENYSCYPIINQLFFLIPALISNNIAINVIVLKVIIILADFGILFVGRQILKFLKKDEHLIWLYILNPFVILEFTGNVHFEGVMILFVLISLYMLLKEHWLMSSVFLGLAVQLKLLPVIILPLLYKKLGWIRALGYSAMLGIVVIVLGMLMLNEEFALNLWSSIRNYFVSFEFNGSVYYLIREIGYWTVGYNNIAVIGPFLSGIVFVLILSVGLLRKYRSSQDLFTAVLFALTVYFAFATTVHPWYVGSVLIFSIFTSYKFGLIWSLLVMLSYSAYSSEQFAERPVFLWLEYILVYGLMIFEIVRLTKKENFGLQIREFFSKSDGSDQV